MLLLQCHSCCCHYLKSLRYCCCLPLLLLLLLTNDWRWICLNVIKISTTTATKQVKKKYFERQPITIEFGLLAWLLLVWWWFQIHEFLCDFVNFFSHSTLPWLTFVFFIVVVFALIAGAIVVFVMPNAKWRDFLFYSSSSLLSNAIFNCSCAIILLSLFIIPFLIHASYKPSWPF